MGTKAGHGDISSTGSNFVFSRNNLFAQIHAQLGVLPGYQGLNNMGAIDQETQTLSNGNPLETVRRDAEVLATYVIKTFNSSEDRKPPNRTCKTMLRTVKELSNRHDIVLKGMVNKLNVNTDNVFHTFVSVADEIFEDGQMNWGRVVAVYAFAARLASSCNKECLQSDWEEKISLYVGKYVGNKLGRWIVENGGWVRINISSPSHQTNFNNK